ncbi:PAS domain S-box [Halovivax ruber XH-70]|uniref:histidine kinase n=1 Tax=Halovivax ruber (strain DSM 18193 / JCM 13892 / XH-70) TaxID=797302 RepID=L0IDW5_HALRX|nr:PAS domain-containing sensor histidine kinase [Halovivax ruber]AGB17028.1 PAS domain S-box [Halovivax ruber XH-70]
MRFAPEPVVRALRHHSVTLVGGGFLAVAAAYAAFHEGSLSLVLLDVFLLVLVGIALLWDGFRTFDESPSPRRTELVAAGTLLFAVFGALFAGWAVVLVELRLGRSVDYLQIGLLGFTIGGALGAMVGHIHASLSAKNRETTRLSRAMDSSMDGMAIIEDGEHVYVNDAYAELYDFPGPALLEGESWYRLYTSESLATIEREVIPKLTEQRYWRGRLTGRRADGTTFPKEVTSSAVEDGHVIVVRDVSTQRQREQRIQVLNRVLRHNLRNTFTVIQGHANLLAEKAPELAQGHVEPIRNEITDLLATADKARGLEQTLEGPTEVQQIDPSEAVRTVVDRATATYPSASIHSHVEESGLQAVDARIVEALNELVDNAVEHAPCPDPTVEVAVETVETGGTSRLEFTVVDDGPGIPEADRRAIIDGEETPLEHGSGLGLWLVNWIVSNTGGDIAFAQPSSGGTEVTITYGDDESQAADGLGQLATA